MPETVTTHEPPATTAAAATPQAAESAEVHSESDRPVGAVGVTETQAPPRMVSVLRRKRRRAKVNPRTLRVRLFLLSFVAGLLVLALAGGDLVRHIAAALREAIPALGQGAQMRLEVIVLVFAALILLYLMPGVEDRVLKALGIKRSGSNRRGRHHHYRQRSTRR